MSKLKLLLLGHFECLLLSGKPARLSMRKAEVLMAFLALTPGIRHPRERLINLLWSNRGEEQARNSLRQCLSAIRKSLGDAAELALQVDRNTVRLNPELIEVDVLEFERLAADSGLESLMNAAELYRGEFLEGISIRDAASQEWMDGERARCKRQYIDILADLGHTQLASRGFNHAIRTAENLVVQDPLSESGWRLLMRACHENGDRSHALQAFKRCQQVLGNELDVEPEAETLALRDTIASGLGKADTPVPAKAETTDSPVASPAATGDHRIAVLPFDNLSGDPEQEYFSDGITDSIILNLAMFPGLQVKSRNSSFAFKEQIKSVGEISDELKVDYIVEGSIRRSQDRIRITVQLIDTAGGNQIWGKRYDADLENLFDLEEELSRTIAATVTGQIEVDLQRIAISKGAAGEQSYDLLLSGIYHSYRFNRLDNLIAIDKLNQCLVQDPNNVRAHAYLYVCHSMDYLGRWTVDFQASFELSKSHIERALQLAPELGLVQTFYAEHLVFSGKPDAASRHLDKALKINPNDTDALATRAICLSIQGDFAGSLQVAEQVCGMDPYHPWAEWELAGGQYESGAYETTLETIASFRTEPGFTQIFAIASHVRLGHLDAAQKTLQNFLLACREDMLSMPQSFADWFLYVRATYPYEDEQSSRDLVDCLVQAGLEDFLDSPAQALAESSHTIAVLPFDNLSGDPAQEYFSDGITESILLNLSLFPGLNVKSRNSSFAFKQQIKSVGEISRELDVDYIVEGSIRKTDDRIRVAVQLVEASSGNQVWGKRYDADIVNLFDLEEELSRTIAATVTGQIESDLQRIALAKGAVHQQAYDFLLAGRYHLDKGNAKDTQIAIEKLNQCLALDPGNALAHTALFWCHDMNVIDRWVEDIEQSRQLLDDHIHQAVALGPELNLVQVAYADYLAFRFRYDEAEQQLRQALEKNPNDSEAIAVQAVNLSLQGKAEAALEKAELALRLDPYHAWARWIKAESQFFCGRYEDCLATLADTPNAPGFIRIYDIAANASLGRLPQARRALDSLLEFCRKNMLSMPGSIDEWLEYYRDNAPFIDPALNDQVIDCMLQAGLEESLSATDKLTSEEVLPTILVLPFSNLSADPEQEYFSDGISESIIVNLGSFNGLNVKSRHTSFAFKNSAKSIDEIAAELAVQYVIEGSIRKFGDKVRITVQVDETATGNQLWGKRFESKLDDLLALEEDLVKSICGSIGGRIGKDIKSASMHKTAKDLKSYDYLMRGLHHLGNFNAEDVAIARAQFQKCLEHDPDNSEAHALLGVSHLTELLEYWSVERSESIILMMKHAEKALQLEPEDAVAHAFMAEVLMYSRDFERAAHHVERALKLNPNLPDGYSMKCVFMASNRHYEEALEYADMSLQIDPYHFYMCWNAGEVYRDCGQFERAIQTFRSLPHIPPSVQAQIAASLAGLGKTDEARSEMQRYLESARTQMPHCPVNEQEWRSYWYEYLFNQYPEDSEKFFQLLLKAGLCNEFTETSDDMPSIAVLPFENMSGDPEQEYFSEGITADIISTLSKFRHLRIVARHSTEIYRKHKVPIAEIAQQQQVRYILEGSVRRSGNRIRVSAELIDSLTEQNCWSERYDRDLDDLFAVQDELTREIALAMKVQLDDGDMARHRSAGTRNIKAWELTMTAVDLQDTYIQQNIVKARSMVKQALALDPEYVFAHVVLAWTFWQDVYSGWSEDPEQSLIDSETSSQRALQLDPDNADALAQAGTGYVMRHNSDKAMEYSRRAVEIEPGNAENQALRAFACIYAGDYEQARVHHQHMRRLCPVLPNWYYLILGQIEQFDGDVDQAISIYKQGIAVEPDSTLCRFYLIHALMQKGDTRAAQKLADEIRALDSSANGGGLVRAVSRDAAVRDHFHQHLARFGLI